MTCTKRGRGVHGARTLGAGMLSEPAPRKVFVSPGAITTRCGMVAPSGTSAPNDTVMVCVSLSYVASLILSASAIGACVRFWIW